MEEKNKIYFKNVKDIISRKVKPYGNGAHITIPKKFLGCNIKIIVLEEQKYLYTINYKVYITKYNLKKEVVQTEVKT